MQNDLLQTIESLILPILDDFKFELVDLEFKREGRDWCLRLFIDKPGGINLDDCVTVSREVEAILEIEDPIKSGYRLEVSSPGIDRPLKTPAHFDQFAGQRVKVKTFELVDPDQRGHTRKTFAGELLGMDGERVRILQTDKQGGEVAIPLTEIAKANLDPEF